ncbi:MAG TPA: methyltransferase domain-containing protein [Vicinamibacterales bacterium]|nr:methyltransferase domain-containing protein [Vicinamibacterales bacterium]
MTNRDVDGLTSATLKHLRERWWDDAFTEFVKDTLQPRAGRRILDVGCGIGTAEVKLSRLRLTQVDFVAVDLLTDRVIAAQAAARAHNISAHFAAADACRLPFPDATFDSVFCVAVLQHIGDVKAAVLEMARVTRPGGRIVAVEPDNSARYFYSSVEDGHRAHDSARRFFSALAVARGDASEPAVGPQLPTLFSQNGIEPLSVHVFPVSGARLGAPAPAVWTNRRASVSEEIEKAPDEAIRRLGQDYLKVMDRYAEAATAAGTGFVEIQNAMLFATVGQRQE